MAGYDRQGINLSANDLFYLTNFFLSLAADFLGSALVLQFRIVGKFASLLLHGTFGFVQFSGNLIFCAFFHSVTPANK